MSVCPVRLIRPGQSTMESRQITSVCRCLEQAILYGAPILEYVTKVTQIAPVVKVKPGRAWQIQPMSQRKSVQWRPGAI